MKKKKAFIEDVFDRLAKGEPIRQEEYLFEMGMRGWEAGRRHGIETEIKRILNEDDDE